MSSSVQSSNEGIELTHGFQNFIHLSHTDSFLPSRTGNPETGSGDVSAGFGDEGAVLRKRERTKEVSSKRKKEELGGEGKDGRIGIEVFWSRDDGTCCE